MSLNVLISGFVLTKSIQYCENAFKSELRWGNVIRSGVNKIDDILRMILLNNTHVTW